MSDREENINRFVATSYRVATDPEIRKEMASELAEYEREVARALYERRHKPFNI